MSSFVSSVRSVQGSQVTGLAAGSGGVSWKGSPLSNKLEVLWARNRVNRVWLPVPRFFLSLATGRDESESDPLFSSEVGESMRVLAGRKRETFVCDESGEAKRGKWCLWE